MSDPRNSTFISGEKWTEREREAILTSEIVVRADELLLLSRRQEGDSRVFIYYFPL
jgi:hypothetical protein